MIRDNASRTAPPVSGAATDIEAYLAGKAYIAVLKHRLTNEDSDRTFKEIFEEAYRMASRGTKDPFSIGATPQFGETADALNEKIAPLLAGKAYIAVLKHRLAHGETGKSSREVFEEAYRAAAVMAHCEPLESLGISGRE